MKTPNDMDQYLTVKEALYELRNRVGRSKLYLLFESGELQKYKIGGRTFVHKGDIGNLIRRV